MWSPTRWPTSSSSRSSPAIQRLAHSDPPTTWRADSVTRSGDGIKGVFFVKDGNDMVIVKPIDDPTNIDYANTVMGSLGFAAPDIPSTRRTRCRAGPSPPCC